MKAKSNRIKRIARIWARGLKAYQMRQLKRNINQLAKHEQLRHALVLLVILGVSALYYHYSAEPNAHPPQETDIHFDGTFDSQFNKESDEALIEKQQRELNALKEKVSETSKNQEALLKEKQEDGATTALIQTMQEKLARLESENQKINEQLQVTLAMNTQKNLAMNDGLPDTPETREARLHHQRALYEKAGLETVHFNRRMKRKKEERTHRNYVWAGTFVEGVLLTGILGDAGINGSKNMGTAMIRLTAPGIMPNDEHSHLEGCFALVSSYGDLSGSSVVLHLETLSCAGRRINFEQKVYGSVFDLDAMQDLRGTSILKTKPLLGYSAAAGLLAGLGDGLKNFNTAQTINPSVGTITEYGTAQVLAQSAAGSALSNPANRVADYVMRIADIYHPLVVARAGRRVSVLFTKGFWIDKKHQVYESGKAIDEANAGNASSVTTTVSRASGMESIANDATPQSMVASVGAPGADDFIRQHESAPLFSTVPNGGLKHG